ncbi:hypothetical protein PR048_003728 [Dryococelus australis]|uniref:Uncharacterized protein n=1 Tax=Dryococelus australis TaxID=614101 RepID=A0ABQ9INU5_9NEOP|nr:hypothetical protein PR048_003728 [Dryococelus australis]
MVPPRVCRNCATAVQAHSCSRRRTLPQFPIQGQLPSGAGPTLLKGEAGRLAIQEKQGNHNYNGCSGPRWSSGQTTCLPLRGTGFDSRRNFFRDHPFPPPLHSGATPFSPHIIGSQDLDIKSLTAFGFTDELQPKSSTISTWPADDGLQRCKTLAAGLILNLEEKPIEIKSHCVLWRSVGSARLWRLPGSLNYRNILFSQCGSLKEAGRIGGGGGCGEIWAAINIDVVRADEGDRRNERAGETGDTRRNPLTSGIVLHDSHM